MWCLSISSVFGKLRHFAASLFENETRPTKENLLIYFMSIPCLDQFRSVRYHFNNQLKSFAKKSINTFYYMFTYSNRVNHIDWCDTNIKHILSLIPDAYKDYPIFVSIDDTLVEKFGKKFEHVSYVYDHVDKKYKNGHCLVGMLISMPFMNSNGSIQYIHVPYTYEIWIPNENTEHSLC